MTALGRFAGAVARAALLVLAAPVVTGCLGAASDITANTSRYPVSLSRAVRDSDGRILTAERRQKVGALKIERTGWSIFYSAIDLSHMDLSDAVNQQVVAAGGDAVVRLTITTKHCALNYFAFPFGILPIWPGCVDVSVTGDIIKARSPALALTLQRRQVADLTARVAMP